MNDWRIHNQIATFLINLVTFCLVSFWNNITSFLFTISGWLLRSLGKIWKCTCLNQSFESPKRADRRRLSSCAAIYKEQTCLEVDQTLLQWVIITLILSAAQHFGKVHNCCKVHNCGKVHNCCKVHNCGKIHNCCKHTLYKILNFFYFL